VEEQHGFERLMDRLAGVLADAAAGR
jgi:hypothetical protein